MPRAAYAYICAVIVGLSSGLLGVTSATAYTDEPYSDCLTTKASPYMKFDKGTAPYGTLYTYYSSAAYCGSQLMVTRRKVTMKAGSGNGSSNTCAVNAGWLPNGSYSPRYERNHQTSSDVVKGSVWYLGNHKCSGGTLRTELFIHSQGGNGGSWTASNYKSQGCIKISQGDRTFLAGLYNQPIYGSSDTSLDVTG